ncbi:DUF1643 domain-containing protein [Lactococcus cremoris]|jgi:hypothetical protein|uniref:DUF1643 domain-containing protein n=1 Tax=Lactococcus lactis subsp. cremoris TaxID=1359 RepID=UPI0021AA68B3|nr:DUF1643 domain-containing protein [Lactococcus cremoris]MCT4454531.1 DUF1643 domain-containing protein [Lactococcus cremoris]
MKYKDDEKEVDTLIEKNIISIKVEYNFSIRNYLNITFNRDVNKKMVIILMNPSKATDKESDPTVSEVLRFAKKEYKKVIIFNVLPFYGTDSDDLSPLFKDESKKEIIEVLLKSNINKIREELLEDKDTEIFLATGCPKDGEVKKVFLSQLQKIYGLLKNNSSVRAFSITEDKKIFLNNEGTTYHPRYLKIKKAFTHEKIVEVVVKDKDGTFSLTEKENAPK